MHAKRKQYIINKDKRIATIIITTRPIYYERPIRVLSQWQ